MDKTDLNVGRNTSILQRTRSYEGSINMPLIIVIGLLKNSLLWVLFQQNELHEYFKEKTKKLGVSIC